MGNATKSFNIRPEKDVKFMKLVEFRAIATSWWEGGGGLRRRKATYWFICIKYYGLYAFIYSHAEDYFYECGIKRL